MNPLQIQKLSIDLLEIFTQATPENIKKAGEEYRKQIALTEADQKARDEAVAAIDSAKSIKAENDKKLDAIKKSNDDIVNANKELDERKLQIDESDKQATNRLTSADIKETKNKEYREELDAFKTFLDKQKTSQDLKQKELDTRDVKIAKKEQKFQSALNDEGE